MTKGLLIKKVDTYLNFKDLYYAGYPIVTDKEFDILEKEILSYRDEFPSIVKRIDIVSSTTADDIIKHPVRMFSLDNVFSIKELEEWMRFDKDTLYTLELKYDGVSLDYSGLKGGIKFAISRGDGKLGTDVTKNVLKTLPRKVGEEDINIHGEVVIKYKTFEKINESRLSLGLKPYISPRNAAASIVMHGGVNEDKLTFIPYAVYTGKNRDKQSLASIASKFTIPFIIGGKREHILKEVKRIYSNPKFDIPADGLVIKVDDEDLIDSLGYTSKFPKFAIALKFPAKDVSTIIKDIVWQVGHTGVLTPVGILEPVQVEDAIVSRVTLNNYNFVKVTELGRNDKVNIIRSGGVIPKLTGVLEYSKKRELFLEPKECPICKDETIIDGPNVKCINDNCKGRVIAKMSRFASRDYADIKGVSDKLIEKLYDKGIKDFISLVSIDRDILSSIEGIEEKSINNILNAIKKIEGLSMDKFLASLGIEGLGRTTGRLIAERITSVKDILTLDLLDIKGIGKITAINIMKGIVLDLGNIVRLEFKLKPVNANNENKDSVCFTGRFKAPRKQLEREYKEKGYTITNKVNKDLSLLVVGEKPSSKLDKAKKLNIPITFQL